MLADSLGISNIRGIMNPAVLNFRKYYEENMGQSFDYKFSLKDGVWLGEYKSTLLDYNGRSVCKTSLCLKDLTFRKFDMGTLEGFAEVIIKNMMENGQLEKSIDPKTGEEIFKPI